MLGGCATPIKVEGVLVTGLRQDISESDVLAAVAAMRSDLPELKAQVLRQIYVVDRDEIWVTFSPREREDRTQYVTKRKHGRWESTGEITI